MARSRLIKIFQSFANDCALSDAIGISPGKFRDLKKQEITRRSLMAASGAVVANSILPLNSARSAFVSKNSNVKVAIVGGGIAGLAAALTLHENGVAASLFEASGRIGGRIHSLSKFWEDGQVSEWCGELIDSNHKTILKLANRYKLQMDNVLLSEPKGTNETFWIKGAPYSVEEAYDDFRKLWPSLSADLKAAGYPTLWNSFTREGQILDQMSIYQWIDTRVQGGHNSLMGCLLDVAYTAEYGAETSDQSALNLIYLLGYQPNNGSLSLFGLSDEAYHINGGNDKLTQAIVDDLSQTGSLIRLEKNYKLISIAKTNNQVSLTFSSPSGKQTALFDLVILALPFSILRKLDYRNANFDQKKVMAITQIGSGRNAKLQMQFASRYWNDVPHASSGEVFTDLGFQSTWETSRAQSGNRGLLVNYSGGNVAESYKPSTPYSLYDGKGLNDKYISRSVSNFLSKLSFIFPGIGSRWNNRAALSVPFLDPNLNIAYSYWRVGQYTSFAGYERMPQGPIHFAGEHCSIDFQGFMEGGASEGIRAGLEVLEALGIKGTSPV
ncbi:MAG: flavin monoamine oxidase family protein [Hyphomicrobium sp.]